MDKSTLNEICITNVKQLCTNKVLPNFILFIKKETRYRVQSERVIYSSVAFFEILFRVASL